MRIDGDAKNRDLVLPPAKLKALVDRITKRHARLRLKAMTKRRKR